MTIAQPDLAPLAAAAAIPRTYNFAADILKRNLDAGRADNTVRGAHPDGNPARRQRGDSGDHGRPQLGHLVGRGSGQLGDQHRR